MRLLLDTQILVWSVATPDRLRSAELTMIRSRRHQVLFSAASIWEVAIKFALRRRDFSIDPSELAAIARLDFVEPPVSSAAAIRVARLPHHHRDPFDRLLVAQAIEEEARLLTADTALVAYGPHVLMLDVVPGRET